jgi:methylenetetrahydrofolate dehydrogenase (NADP+)/methenyltetrahydrofolate cyclohydrolase
LIFYTNDLVEKYKQEIKQEIKHFKKKQGITPVLSVVQIGNDFASNIYVRNKQKACLDVGIDCKLHNFAEKEITPLQLVKFIKELNDNKRVHAILIQLPLPSSFFNVNNILNVIDKTKDVDGFCPYNIGALVLGVPSVIPCTPLAVLNILKSQNFEIRGKHCVILGRSNIVGKPMAALMLSESATITVCHTGTKNLADFCRSADILICATGCPKFVTQEMVKPGCIVIDVGISRDENQNCCGDVDFENVKNKASFITPVPGGVGPMTIAMLLKNTLDLYRTSILHSPAQLN